MTTTAEKTTHGLMIKRIHPLNSILIGLLLVFGLVGTANATLILGSFEGTKGITGSFSYDADTAINPDQRGGNTSLGKYNASLTINYLGVSNTYAALLNTTEGGSADKWSINQVGGNLNKIVLGAGGNFLTDDAAPTMLDFTQVTGGKNGTYVGSSTSFGFNIISFNLPANDVPEPATLSLLGLGLLGLGVMRRRRVT